MMITLHPVFLTPISNTKVIFCSLPGECVMLCTPSEWQGPEMSGLGLVFTNRKEMALVHIVVGTWISSVQHTQPDTDRPGRVIGHCDSRWVLNQAQAPTIDLIMQTVLLIDAHASMCASRQPDMSSCCIWVNDDNPTPGIFDTN